MGKNKFIAEMERLLRQVPKHDREEMLSDYEEHFAIGTATGKTDSELIDELGSPSLIAKELLAEYRVEKAEKDKSFSNIFRAIISAMSLSFLNLIFMAGPLAGVLGVYLSLWIVSVSFVLMPLAIVVLTVLGYNQETFAFSLFTSITLFSLGSLMAIGMTKLGKWLYNVMLRYVRFNLNIIKGEKVA